MPAVIPEMKLRFNQFISPDLYLESLEKCLPNVQNEVYLNQFVLTSKSLKSLMESASNCGTLAIYDCKVDLSEEFKLDKEIEYKYKILNMSLTIVDNDPDNERINPEKLETFVAGLAETNLKETLETVYLWESYYSSPEKVEAMFKKHGFVCTWQEEP